MLQATHSTSPGLLLLCTALLLGCQQDAGVDPRETSKDVTARAPARRGEERAAQNYAAVGERTAHTPSSRSPSGSPDEQATAAANDAGDPADPLADFLTARASCESLDDATSQADCLDEARAAYRRMTGRDPEAALPPSER